MSSPKTESELRAQLKRELAVDARVGVNPSLMAWKAAACKTLLWALGENDDDRWHITAIPGPPVDARAKARN